MPHGRKEQPKRITKHEIFIWVNKLIVKEFLREPKHIFY